MIENNIKALILNFIIVSFMTFCMYCISQNSLLVESYANIYLALYIVGSSILYLISGYLFLKPIKHAYFSGLVVFIITMIMLIQSLIFGASYALYSYGINPIIAIMNDFLEMDILSNLLIHTIYLIMSVNIPILMYVGILLRQKFCPRKNSEMVNTVDE